MTSTLVAHSAVRLILLAGSDHASLAAPVLARHLQISAETARARLMQGPGVLAENLPAPVGRSVVTLLRALGLRVTLDTAAGPSEASLFDVSLQCPQPQRHLIDRLAKLLGRASAKVAAGLTRPGGIVVPGLAADAVAALRHKLRALTGLQITGSCRATAIHDLYAALGGAPGARLALSIQLRHMGLLACPITGALASGLDAAALAHLSPRLAPAGVFALDRRFQRFDLYLTASRNLALVELSDFFATRPGTSGVQIGAMSLACPLRIETGLTHAAARQFRADYAAIGMDTALALTPV